MRTFRRICVYCGSITGDARYVYAAERLGRLLASRGIGLVFGGGVDFVQGWGSITIDARYVWGLTDIVDVDEDFTADDGNLRSGSFWFSGGVIF